MKIRFIPLPLLLVALSLGGQLSAQPLTSKLTTLPPDTKLAGTGVLYSKSFFQERYMKVGRTIATGLFIGGLYQQAVWRATGKYEGKAPVRQEANGFEALLGEFDVTVCVNERLRVRLPEARHFDIKFTSEAALAEALVDAAAAPAKAGQVVAGGGDVLCVVKVSYGLGARAGREQIGFKKTYRPFVRLLGVVQRNGTGEVLWHGAVIGWGAKGYKGAEADAKKVPREELIGSFKAVAEDAVSLFIRSLNGEALAPMGELVDETTEDTKF